MTICHTPARKIHRLKASPHFLQDPSVGFPQLSFFRIRKVRGFVWNIFTEKFKCLEETFCQVHLLTFGGAFFELFIVCKYCFN